MLPRARAIVVAGSAEVGDEYAPWLLDGEQALEYVVVTSSPALTSALDGGEWDVALVDLASSPIDALALVADLGHRHLDLPVVVVSAPGVRPEPELIVRGAYGVPRADLSYLPPTITRALADLRQRRLRRQAEEGLRQSEVRLRQLGEAAFEGIVISSDGVVLDANEQFCVLVGRSAEELLGMALVDLVAPESRDLVRSHLQYDTVEPYELWIQRRDGTRVLVEARGRMAFLSGRWLRCSAILDISEQRRAQSELRERLETQRLISELTTSVLMSSGDRMVQAVRDWLPGLVRFAEAESAEVRVYEFDPVPAAEIIAWPLAPRDPRVDQFRLAHAADVVAVLPQLASGQPIVVGSRGEWSCSDLERELLFPRGYRPAIVAPIRHEGRVYGTANLLGPLGAEHTWPQHIVDLVSTCAGILGNAFARRFAERRLQDAQQRHQAVSEQAGQMVYDWSPRNGTIKWAGAVHEVTGYSMEEISVLGSEDRVAHIYSEDRERVQTMRAAAVDARSAFSVEYRLRRADGRLAWVLETGLPLVDASGINQRVVGAVQDISELRAATDLADRLTSAAEATKEGMALADADGRVTYTNQASPMHDAGGQAIGAALIWTDLSGLETMEERLRQAIKLEAIGTFASGIAHDFNNVLGIIAGNADLAELIRGNEEELLTCLRQIKLATQRASDLTRQILTFARRTEDSAEPVSVGMAVWEALQLLGSVIPDSVELVTQVDRKLGTVVISPSQLHQVVMNLCTNACQAIGPKAGQVVVGLNRAPTSDLVEQGIKPTAEGYARLTVWDSGPGIEPAILNRVVEPFFTTKPPGQGTGMGLALVHGIVVAAGGTLVLGNHPAGGAVVSIYLPLSAERSATREEDTRITGGHRRILVVDDEPAMVSWLTRLLESIGHTVVGVGDGEQALNLVASSETIEVMLVDYSMPGLSGFDLAELVHRLRPALPVILMTGLGAGINETTALAAGCQAFLWKPVNAARLTSLISQLTSGPPH
ncbi:MAG: PAS domain S-box protein [Armatimonadetes bacterium]|nr:PAS domain S-box protein [Armatimonadota bacterium]